MTNGYELTRNPGCKVEYFLPRKKMLKLLPNRNYWDTNLTDSVRA